MEIRLLKGHDFNEAVRLADWVFKRDGRISLETAFPHIYTDATSHSYGLFADNRLASFIGFVPSVVTIGAARLNVYSVGSVCTHPDYAGRGYAGEVLKQVIRHAEQAGASLILVSGHRQLYTRAGCYPFGAFTQYRIGKEVAAAIMAERAKDVHLRPMIETDLFDLNRLFADRTTRFERSVWDAAFLIKTVPIAKSRGYTHQVYLAERQGKVEAFVVVAIPGSPEATHHPFVVEYGGSPEGCAQLFAHVISEHGLDAIKVVLSIHEKEDRELGAKLEKYGTERIELRNSGTVRIVDPGRLIEQAASYLRDKHEFTFGSLRMERASELGYVIVACEGHQATITDSQLVSLLFDEMPQLPDVDHILAADLKRLFPLPFPYVSGLNYI
ncbi:GNAT family N-acetyltransferase [Paenibacillus sp. NPDC056579]|uniref:GNAT family N-acetyltransferase n=1 Tax=Paenibacillus sp. NPDC056579 TaxID=3345871 RepID=UPI0036B7E5EC